MWLITLGILVLLIVLVWSYSRVCHNYWQKRGVPVPQDYVPILGHSHKFFSTKVHSWLTIDKYYRQNGGSTFCGVYEQLSPQLLIGDLELIKTIMIKDFDHFVDRRHMEFTGEIDKIFENMLTNASGNHWKGIRSVLSPSFTSGRMKGMFPLVAQKADDLIQFLGRKSLKDSAVELKKSFGYYTLEVIASCAFGLETNSLGDDGSEFATRVTEFIGFNFEKLIKALTFFTLPQLCRALKVNLISSKILFFRDVVLESMKQRDAGVIKRGDFLDLWMQAREDQKDASSKMPKYPLSDTTIVSESILFLLAGYDTTSNTLSFLIFLLAKYPKIQTRLREELQAMVEEHGEVTYQGVMEAKYLDACLSESLRLYSPASRTERTCTKNYRIPGTDVTIPKDMIIKIPIYSIHHDDKFWPEPEEFLPERFMPQNKENIISGTYLPFGLGPRNCIGMRFALMEAKLAITKVLLNFELSCPPGQEEMKLSNIPGLTRPSDDLSVVFTYLKEE